MKLNLQDNMDDSKLLGSEIQQYFAESTVFVTGATGFLGRLLVEKLLRTCRDLKRIYILMRRKKDKSCEKRFEEYFNHVIYDRLKEENPKALEKVYIIAGDCGRPDLDINEKDMEILISEVNCIFHCAATVRFDEKIRTAAYINIRGTRDLLRIGKRMKHLSSMVYVSTAFSFSPRETIDETFYEPAMTGDQLLNLLEDFDDEKLDAMTPVLLDKWPNTYVFTKSIAEDVVKKEGADLPIAVVRPSIVLATEKEPIPGWIDNFYGATGVIAGVAVGLIRTMQCNPQNLAEMVPADYVINSCIAVAWDVANTRTFKKDQDFEVITENKVNPQVFNYVSSPEKPLTWEQCMDASYHHGQLIYSVLQVWHNYVFLIPNKYMYTFLHYTLHLLPAYIIDFLGFCVGKRPGLVKAYTKISKFLDVLSCFATREWSFGNENTRKLWGKLNSEDKKSFEFGMDMFDWDSYFKTYMPGIRVYLLKDPMETVPQGVAKAFRLRIANYVLVGALILVFLKFVLIFYNAVF